VNDPDKSIDRLRAYLDDVGFANLYRYIVAPGGYYLSPFAVNGRSAPAVLATDTWLTGSLAGVKLIWALLGVAPVELSALSAGERELVGGLVTAGLLAVDGNQVRNQGLQLICVGDAYLFIDAALTFPLGRHHEVYIGPDTMLLIHYLDRARLGAGSRVLDLCTGTGVIGLMAARAGARVVSTDIAERPLALADINRALNGFDDVIEIRRQDVAETLVGSERWDLVACNPPFIAVPPELALPVFARGPGRDGLDMMRSILAALDRLLDEEGSAVLVADMVGDERQPYFVAELEALADRFAVDVYLDQRLPAEGHALTMGRILASHNPGLEVEAATARARDLILGELGAKAMYLTVLRVRRAREPRFLVLNRYKGMA
jgi:SAM-dependent methyltransferase